MIRYAKSSDLDELIKYDKHISKEELLISLNNDKVILMYDEENFIGWLRYNYFWDNTPFMNMLYLLDEYRGKGYGKELVSFWERKMKDKGFEIVLTSTLSNEEAQFFYRKLDYKDCGALLLPEEPLEIILYKSIK